MCVIYVCVKMLMQCKNYKTKGIFWNYDHKCSATFFMIHSVQCIQNADIIVKVFCIEKR